MKKKGILSFSIFLILVIAIAVYCWPVSRVWFPEPEKLQLIDVNVYENGIVKQLSEEEMQAICQLLSGMKTTRNLGRKGSYRLDDYPVSIFVGYDLVSADQDTCMILLGKTFEMWSTLHGRRVYAIENGDELLQQLTNLLSAYYE